VTWTLAPLRKAARYLYLAVASRDVASEPTAYDLIQRWPARLRHIPWKGYVRLGSGFAGLAATAPLLGPQGLGPWLLSAAFAGALCWCIVTWFFPEGVLHLIRYEDITEGIWITRDTPSESPVAALPQVWRASCVIVCFVHHGSEGSPYRIALSDGGAVGGSASDLVPQVVIDDPWKGWRRHRKRSEADPRLVTEIYGLLDAVVALGPQRGLTVVPLADVRGEVATRQALSAEDAQEILGATDAREWVRTENLDRVLERAINLGLLKRRGFLRGHKVELNIAGEVWYMQRSRERGHEIVHDAAKEEIRPVVYQYKAIYIGGDAEITAPIVIADNIEEAFKHVQSMATGAQLTQLLEELGREIVTVATEIGQGPAEDLSIDFETLTRELDRKEPRADKYHSALDSLRATAGMVGQVGMPLVELASKVKELLGG
jgi:hypothetical protein